MYGKQTVEKFLSAKEKGMTLCEAAEFAGITFWAARCWSSGRLPQQLHGHFRRTAAAIRGRDHQRT